MKCKLIAPVILAYVVMAEFITKFYFKKSLVRLCPLNTNSWFLGSRSPTLPTRSGTWKGNSDHVNEAVESGHWWSLMMYTVGSASEQKEVNPTRKELPAFFSKEKQPPSVACLWYNTDSSFFHVQLVVMGLLAFSRFKPPFARAPDHFFSNCCCGANQGCPKTLKCTIYPFLRIMTQKQDVSWQIRISELVLWQTLKCLNTTPV